MRREAVRSPTTLLLAAVAMMGPLDTPPVGPALPAIAAAFDVPASSAGLVISAYAATGALLAPVIGSLADRHGRRRVLVPCLVGYGCAGVLAAAAPTFWILLACRALQGLFGGSILTSLAFVVIGDRHTGADRNAAIGVIGAGVSLTAAVAPALGGALAAVSWRATFLLYGVSALVGVAVLRWLPESDRTDEENAASTRAYVSDVVRAVPPRRAIVSYAACFLGFGLFFGGVLTGATFLLHGEFGLGSGRIGAVVTAATLFSAVSSALNGRFAAWLSDDAMVALGIAVEGVGLFVVGSAWSVPAVAAGLVVFGAGYGLFQPALAASLSTLGPERVRGGVLSLRSSVLLGSTAIAPLLFTLSEAAVGYHLPLLAAGTIAVLAGAGWAGTRAIGAS